METEEAGDWPSPSVYTGNEIRVNEIAVLHSPCTKATTTKIYKPKVLLTDECVKESSVYTKEE